MTIESSKYVKAEQKRNNTSHNRAKAATVPNCILEIVFPNWFTFVVSANQKLDRNIISVWFGGEKWICFIIYCVQMEKSKKCVQIKKKKQNMKNENSKNVGNYVRGRFQLVHQTASRFYCPKEMQRRKCRKRMSMNRSDTLHTKTFPGQLQQNEKRNKHLISLDTREPRKVPG